MDARVARAQRKLTVLASLDVAGYTRHMEREERGTLLALARIRMRILRPTLEVHGGTMFKTMGDGALIEFPNVEDSVRWGIAFPDGDGPSATPGARRTRSRCASASASPMFSSRAKIASAPRGLRRAASAGGTAGRHRHYAFGALATGKTADAGIRPHGMGSSSRTWTSSSRSGCGAASGLTGRTRATGSSASRIGRWGRRGRRGASSRRLRWCPRCPSRQATGGRAVDRGACLRQHVGRSLGRFDHRRRGGRGDHGDAVAGARLQGGRPQLSLCLQGPVG